MIQDDSLYSENETKASINQSTYMKNDIHEIIEVYDKLNSEVLDDSKEKIIRLEKILEKLRKFESENTLVSDLINEIENKIKLLNTFYDQEKEIENMVGKVDLEENKPENTNLHYAVYNKYEYKEEDDFPRLTEKWINKFLCSDYRLYYRTHELNECLYLHFKGFKIIENLDTFINLKVLYLEGNSIKKIQGLNNLVNLCSLYLHQNVIEKIEGLDELKNLYNLNLSENCISKIENLGNLPKLSNLLLKGNRIGINGIEDVSKLTEVIAVAVVDLSDNRIDDADVKQILSSITTLRVVYLQGNECIRKIAHYRKTMIYSMKDLRYLDDKPVFEDERLFANAFGIGGLDEERKVRDKYRKEKQEAELQRIRDFRSMVDGWRSESSNVDDPSKNTQVEEHKENVDKEKEEMRKKLLLKCKNKSSQMIIKEENIDLENVNSISKNNKNEIFDDLPDLETVKNLKDSGFIEDFLEKEKYNLENVIDSNENKNSKKEKPTANNFEELD